MSGISLVEILLAFFIVAISVLPLVRTFSQSYELATRQHEQQTALKIAEAAANKFSAVSFSDLHNGPDSVPFAVHITPDHSETYDIVFDGHNGTASFQIGKSNYNIGIDIKKIFDPGGASLTFYYYYPEAPAPSPFEIDKALLYYTTRPPDKHLHGLQNYFCTDSMLQVHIVVTYGEPPKRTSMSLVRSDLHK